MSISRATVLGLAALAASSSCIPARAAPKKTVESKKATEKTKEDKPALVATFGDWNVFVGKTGKGRICYTLAQPKSREPDSLKRDAGYAFISDRPAEGVRNEVSFIMGFDIASGEAEKPEEKPKRGAKAAPKAKPAPAPIAAVGEENFDLLPKGGNLWVKNAARESALIGVMKKGVTLEIKAASAKGNPSTDTYSLSGFSQAMDRLQKECASKS